MGQQRRRWAKAGGFTFVEILAALLFLAAVVPVIVTALTLSNKASEWTERGGVAGELAENKLNELLVGDAWQSGSSTSGDFAPDWPGYRWELTQSVWTGGGSATGVATTPSVGSTSSSTSSTSGLSGGVSSSGTLNELKVAVFFKIHGNERSVALSTLVNTLTSSATTTSSSTVTGGVSK